MWARREELAQEINSTHRNSDYLRGIKLPNAISATSNLAQAVKGLQEPVLRRQAWCALAELAEQRQDTAGALQAWKQAAQQR